MTQEQKEMKSKCRKINYEIAMDILKNLSEEKKKVLENALTRNLILTSSFCMSFGEMTIYKEGFLLVLKGTRCSFSVYVKDNDGILQETRKPIENKLHKLYTESLCFGDLGESGWYDIVK